MEDILSEIDRWQAEGKPVALATVVQTWGSSPRRVGAKMAVTSDGDMAGSVSGGCVEGAVVEACIGVLESGQPRLLHFGVADETAWDVGLACGGTIEVFAGLLDPAVYAAYKSALESEAPVAAVTVIKGPDSILGRGMLVFEGGEIVGTISSSLDGVVEDITRQSLSNGETHRRTLSVEPEGEVELFIESTLPPPVLVVVGGVHIAVALVAFAGRLGYKTIVIDPRRSFGSQNRFPDVDRLIQAWPEEAFGDIKITPRTAIVMLTHDPKIDDPALKVALPSQAFYIGALGSRKTQAKRRQRLLEAGLTEGQLDRIHGPVGLDIGARTPQEIALSIMAQIVSAHSQITGN